MTIAMLVSMVSVSVSLWLSSGHVEDGFLGL